MISRSMNPSSRGNPHIPQPRNLHDRNAGVRLDQLTDVGVQQLGPDPFAAMATAIAADRSTEEQRPTPPGTSGIVMSVAASAGDRAPTQITETPIAGRLALGFKLGIRSRRERRRHDRRLRPDRPADRDRDDARPGERDPQHRVGRAELCCDRLRPVPARASPSPPGARRPVTCRVRRRKRRSCHPFWAMLTRRGRRRAKARLDAGRPQTTTGRRSERQRCR
jgi:hypothetical protein